MPSINLVTRTPAANAISVSPATEVFVAVSLTGLTDLDLFYINVGGLRAFTYTAGSIEFNVPEFSGKAVIAPPFFSVTIFPRRRFNPGNNPTFQIYAERTDGILYTLSSSSVFSIEEQTVALLDPALKMTRVDSSFSVTTALEVFRTQLLYALRPRVNTTSAVVQLFHAVYFSQLRSMTQFFDLPSSINKEVLRIAAKDIVSFVDISAYLDKIEVLWLAVLSELQELGVSTLNIQLISRAHNSVSPQERVAAACAAVLLCAKQLTLMENPVTYP